MKKNKPSYFLEEDVISRGYNFVAGVDEAGRGPGAGPVAAAAVRIPREYIDELLETKINDSKKLSEKVREKMYDRIIETCDYGVGIINNDIIDEINILEATKLAMIKAVNDLNL